MLLEGPEKYKLAMTPDGYKVECSKGTSKFSGLATRLKTPKLYIVSVDLVECSPVVAGGPTDKLSSKTESDHRLIRKLHERSQFAD